MIKLFTHTDLDGVGCAVLSKLAFGDDVDVSFCNYDEINIKVAEFFDNNTEDVCHITDISVNEELAEKIDKSKKLYHLLDHHPTALGLNKYNWCKVEVEDITTKIKTSGTELYYKWLIDENCLEKSYVLERFVDVVRNYDTWRWATLGEEGIICKQINDLLYLYGRDKFINWCIAKIYEEVFPKLGELENMVLRIKQKEIDDYVEEKNKQLFTSPMCGKVCGFVFADKYFSELGNRLCKMHPEIDFVAMIDMNGTVSYRTVKEDIDLCKDVARLFGGGGHSKAAGSQFSRIIQLETVKSIFGGDR